MIERVVVPVNFTEESERALLVAPVLANWAGANVELVTVVEPVERPEVEPRLSQLAEAYGQGTTWRVVETGGPLEPVLVTELRRRETRCGASARTLAAPRANCSSAASARSWSEMRTCPSRLSAPTSTRRCRRDECWP